MRDKSADTTSEPKSAAKQATKPQEPKLLRLSSRPLDEPSYLVYLISEEIERNKDNNVMINYKLMRVKEDGADKKEIFSYISDEINEEEPTHCTFRTYGQDNVAADCNDGLKIFDKLGVRSKKAETFNSKYGDKYSIYVPTSEVSPNNTLLASSKLKLDRFKVPFDDPKQKNIVEVLNLETSESKSYELPGSFNRPSLHFSPDNKKLYACYCGFGWEGPFFWQGPTEANFEIDLTTGEVNKLDYITKLKLRENLFRYDPNTVYGASFGKFDYVPPPDDIVPYPQGGELSQRAKKLYRIFLDSEKVETINFDRYFTYIDVSPRGSFADFALGRGDRFIKNLKSGEEWVLEGYSGSYWSDSEKISLQMAKGESTELYIYNPKDKTKILLGKFGNEPVGNKSQEKIRLSEVVGWIH